MSTLTPDGTVEPVSLDRILRCERGQGNIHFSCSANHEQEDWQPYPVILYSAIRDDHTYIHTYMFQIVGIDALMILLYYILITVVPSKVVVLICRSTVRYCLILRHERGLLVQVAHICLGLYWVNG